MKLNVTKEWCMKMVELEKGSNIRTGYSTMSSVFKELEDIKEKNIRLQKQIKHLKNRCTNLIYIYNCK